MNNSVCAVVVTYNRSELLKRCLESLLNQTYPVDRIFVVDNCSTDNTRQVVKEIAEGHKGILAYHRLHGNYGGAGGFYRGFQLAKEFPAKWAVFMDDDAAPVPDYIEKIMKASEEHEDTGCFIGTEYVGESNRRAYGGRRRIVNNHTLKEAWVGEEEYKQNYFEIDTLTFVGPVIRQDMIHKAGLPDKSFFIYYDDTDYSFKIRRYTKILCIPSARINHRTSFEKDVMGESKKIWRRFYMYRNHFVVKKRYIPGISYKIIELAKLYLKEIIQELRNGRSFYYIMIITRGTIEALAGKLGKVNYIDYD